METAESEFRKWALRQRGGVGRGVGLKQIGGLTWGEVRFRDRGPSLHVCAFLEAHVRVHLHVCLASVHKSTFLSG